MWVAGGLVGLGVVYSSQCRTSLIFCRIKMATEASFWQYRIEAARQFISSTDIMQKPAKSFATRASNDVWMQE